MLCRLVDGNCVLSRKMPTALLLVAGLFIATLCLAQEPGAKAGPAKARGRLPPLYKDVVTEAQRQKIYSIQAKYSSEIDGLEARIKRLQAEQTKAIEDVLEADQKAKLQRLRAAAEAKKKKDKEPEGILDALK